MNFIDTIVEKWNTIWKKTEPFRIKAGGICRTIGNGIGIVWGYLVRLRKIFAAIPVAWAAVMLAIRNMIQLPDVVGIGLQIDGSYTLEMGRELAVLGPVAITALCLLLMFCSKRILTPWVVSAVSLLLPVFIWVINVFPY